MSTWEKLPAWEGRIHQGCLNCPPVLPLADMDMVIAIGFGYAGITRDRKDVWHEPIDAAWEDLPTLAHFEEMAAADPDHDWRAILDGPMRGRTYQRQGPGQWVLVASNQGFA